VQSIIEEANRGRNQFITVNTNKPQNPNNKREIKSEYRLEIPDDAPLYFAANSRILRHLLLMCQRLTDLPDIFNSSFIFLTRIRCKWIAEPVPEPVPVPVLARPRPRRANIFEPAPIAKKNQAGSDLADALINPESTEEQNAAVQIVGQAAANTQSSNAGGSNATNKGGRRRTHRRTSQHRQKKLRLSAKAGNHNLSLRKKLTRRRT
jgi:hypothetical protein